MPKYVVEYNEMGGYDGMSSAYHIVQAEEPHACLATLEVDNFLISKGTYTDDWDARHSENEELKAIVQKMADALNQ